MRTLCVTTSKGGPGKTSISFNVAAGMAARGLKVLAVDLDPQANLTMALTKGVGTTEHGSDLVLMNQQPASQLISHSQFENLCLLPSGPQLANVAASLQNEVARESRLQKSLAEVEQSFDVCVIDTCPTLGVLVINALVAAENVIVPCVPGLFDVAGLASIQETMDQVREWLNNPELKILGIALNRVQRSRITKDVRAQLTSALPGLVFDSELPQSVVVEESICRFQTVSQWKPKSKVAVAFENLTEEVIDRGQYEIRSGAIRDRQSTTPQIRAA